MRNKALHLAAASAAALSVLPTMAMAQEAASAPRGAYGTLGYGQHDYDGPDVGAVQGRLGYRFNKNLAVEGEAGAGVKRDKDSDGALDSTHKITRQGAVYGVAVVPVSPTTEVFARAGYGATQIKSQYELAGVTGSDKDTVKSVRVGAGAQHYFDGKNGLRVDYTREEATKGDPDSNTWSMGYVRRF
jgi:outer membrane immunogenic protein